MIPHLSLPGAQIRDIPITTASFSRLKLAPPANPCAVSPVLSAGPEMQLMLPFSVPRRPVEGRLSAGFPRGLGAASQTCLSSYTTFSLWQPLLSISCAWALAPPPTVDPPPPLTEVPRELLVRCLLLANSSGPFLMEKNQRQNKDTLQLTEAGMMAMSCSACFQALCLPEAICCEEGPAEQVPSWP